MASSPSPVYPFLSFFLVLASVLISSINGEHPVMVKLPRVTTLSFEEGYMQLFGDNNLMLHGDGKRVHISLDERTGAGFASQGLYLHGFFSAKIKLPSDYAAGVVVAFYMSNGDVFQKTHDELDFEFLGNIKGREWRVQTNVYGNGSTSIGREERYGLWFDPTQDFHQYSILWSHDRIIFYIDETPIREVVRSKSMGGEFPSKPMSLYATIWDGSDWATSGGRYPVNYKYAPYIAEFTDLVLHGCGVNTKNHKPLCDKSNTNLYNSFAISDKQKKAMDKFRTKYLTYGYCYDRLRYAEPQPECSIGPEAELYLPSGEARSYDRRRHGKRHRRVETDSML